MRLGKPALSGADTLALTLSRQGLVGVCLGLAGQCAQDCA